MSITYAGYPLLLDDPDGTLKAWFDRYCELQDFTAGQPQEAILLPQSVFGVQRGKSLAPAWPPKKPRLNTLYWPTGAARWSCFYGLVDQATLEQLPASGDFSMADDDGGNGLSVTMYALPAQAVSSSLALKPEEILWIIRLVDARYFWQYKNTGDLEIDPETESWTSLFTTILDALGADNRSITTSEINLKIPDVTELSRRCENAAEVLDAAANSVGFRVVVSLEGEVWLQDWTQARASFEELAANNERSIICGGGDKRGGPNAVRVTFQKWYYGRPDPKGRVWTKIISGSSIDSEMVTFSGEKLIHCTAFADFSTDPDATDPDNQSDLEGMATLLATAYYKSLRKRYSATFAGLIPWESNAFDDWTEYRFGALACNGEYHAETRVKSLDLNWGVETAYCQFDDKPVIASPCLCVLDGTLSKDSSTPATVWERDGAAWAERDDAFEIEVWDWVLQTGKQIPNFASRAIANFLDDSLRWVVVQTLECPAEE